MARNITLRCSDAVYKRIQTAVAVRGSGLFPPIVADVETNEEAAAVDAILADWKDGLTPESIARGRDAHLEAITAPLRPFNCDPHFLVPCPGDSAHGRGEAQAVADAARDMDADAKLAEPKGRPRKTSDDGK